MAFSWQLALAGLIAAATHAQGGGKPPASVYVDTACINYSAAYKPLVTSYLSQYRSGFSTAELLQMPTAYNGSRLQAEFQGALPVVYLLDGKIWLDTSLPQPGGKRLKNMEYFGIPLLQQLAQLTVLPDMVIRYSPFDEALSHASADAAPWFGYCSIPQQARTLLLPATLKEASLQCLNYCQAGPLDMRDPRAIFLGKPTGWEKGKRKAVLQAGLDSPEHAYTGLTGDPECLMNPEETATFKLQPPLPLSEQVTRYKYIVNVEGHCSALRLKHLLAGPSAVLFVQSEEIEWFYPLLNPFVHYIPVRFERTGGTQDFQVDLAEKVAWAESNPDRVEAIVREANAFAARYLSKRGQQCFAIQLLNEYANLLKDPWELRRMKRRGQHIRVSAKDGWS